MTGGLAFLLVAVALSIVGSVVLWARSRQPTSLEHGIEEFSREMRALSPDRPVPGRRVADAVEHGGTDAPGAGAGGPAPDGPTPPPD